MQKEELRPLNLLLAVYSHTIEKYVHCHTMKIGRYYSLGLQELR